MKKVLLVVAVLGLGWATQGCKKEIGVKPETPQDSNAIERVKSNDGVLIFEDEKHMYDYMEQTTFITHAERLRIENKLNFQSLYSIEVLVNEAEDKNQIEYYGDLDPSLSLEELRNMGYNYQPSAIFNEFKSHGVVDYITQKDKNVVLELVFDHIFYKTVVGVQKKLIVGENLYVFDAGEMKIFNVQTNELISVNHVSLKNGNGNQHWHKGIGDGSCCRSHYKEIVANTYRVRSYIEFTSNFGSQENYSLNMFWVNQAQENKWGSWQIRDSYKPIWGLEANWSVNYQWRELPSGQVNTRSYGVPLCFIFPSGSGISAPYNTSNWSHNNLPPITMRPTGSFPASQHLFTVSQEWYRAIQESSGSYYVKISGQGGGIRQLFN
jgi:hypothetical protein